MTGTLIGFIATLLTPLWAWLAIAHTALQTPQDQVPEWPTPAGERTEELTHPDAEVDAFLGELESADEGLEDARASILYIRQDMALESVVTRLGDLVFVAPARDDAAAGVFAVSFDTLIDDLGRRSERVKRWVFDGRWLVEQDFSSKSYVRREIARAGDGADPMRLGEGPLPIPIGQEKRAILERYEVSMPAVAEGLERAEGEAMGEDIGGDFLGAVENRAVQVKLVPRVLDGEGFDEVRLWYRRAEEDGEVRAGGRLLPMLAKATTMDGRGRPADVAWVFLSDVSVNVGVDRDEVVAPPPEGEGWSVETRLLPRRPGEGGGR